MIMPAIERLTITMPAEMAATVRAAVEGGGYASTSEIIREALRDWTQKQDVEHRALASLRELIAEGDAGEDIPADAAFAELDRIVAEVRAARG
jgi:antitoxin ParD1/3/4